MKNNIALSENNTTQTSLYNIRKEVLSKPNYAIDTISLKRDYLYFEQVYEPIKKEEKTSTIEEYKDIPDYEGHYQVSNLGNIKSLKRNGERVLKPSIDKTKGYYRICLYKNKKRKSAYIHQLVAMAFLNHIPNGNKTVIDHIDYNEENNKLDNLQVISNRENLSKDKWRYNPSSLYTGVSKGSTKKKWESSISVKGNSFHLGYFNSETIAGLEYKKALEFSDEHSNLTGYPFKTNRRNAGNSNDINQIAINFTLTR
jgi:hypothetical protein